MLTRRRETGIVFSPGLTCVVMIAIALLLYRTTRRIDHSPDRREGLTLPKLELTSRLLEDTSLPAKQAVPAAPASGDEIV